MEDALPDSLAAGIQSAYGLRLGAASAVSRGNESAAWRVDTEQGPVAVLLYPAWRTFEEMAWVHRLITGVGHIVPEAVAPMAMRDGGTLLRYDDRLAALFPFVSGDILNREDAFLRQEAARLLAGVHRASLALTALGARPASGPDAPASWVPPPDPAELHDPELDRLLDDLAVGRRRLRMGPIHGDYYRGNVLTRDGRIVAIIDWNEARHDWLIKELAWCTWEFAKTSTHDDWHEDRARAFLAAYAAEGGPVPEEEYALVPLFVRYRLREEIRLFRAATHRGEPWWDSAYAESEVRAFQTLRDRRPL